MAIRASSLELATWSQDLAIWTQDLEDTDRLLQQQQAQLTHVA